MGQIIWAHRCRRPALNYLKAELFLRLTPLLVLDNKSQGEVSVSEIIVFSVILCVTTDDSPRVYYSYDMFLFMLSRRWSKVLSCFMRPAQQRNSFSPNFHKISPHSSLFMGLTSFTGKSILGGVETVPTTERITDQLELSHHLRSDVSNSSAFFLFFCL